MIPKIKNTVNAVTHSNKPANGLPHGSGAKSVAPPTYKGEKGATTGGVSGSKRAANGMPFGKGC